MGSSAKAIAIGWSGPSPLETRLQYRCNPGMAMELRRPRCVSVTPRRSTVSHHIPSQGVGRSQIRSRIEHHLMHLMPEHWDIYQDRSCWMTIESKAWVPQVPSVARVKFPATPDQWSGIILHPGRAVVTLPISTTTFPSKTSPEYRPSGIILVVPKLRIPRRPHNPP